MITDPLSSLTGTRSNRKESSFLAKMPLLKSVEAANRQSPPISRKLWLCTTRTPRLRCFLTNAITGSLNLLHAAQNAATNWGTSYALQQQIWLSFLLTKEPKYKDKGGNGEAKCTFYSIRKKLSALALRFILAFSEEAVWRNHLRLCLFPRDLVYYYQFGF